LVLVTPVVKPKPPSATSIPVPVNWINKVLLYVQHI